MSVDGKTSARGYGRQHQLLRESYRPAVEAGEVWCWRCEEWIDPAEPWDLGHDDDDRTLYRGPEHRACNRDTRGRGRRGRVKPRRASMDW